MTQIEELEAAWRAALTEFIALDPLDEKSQFDSLMLVIRNIRFHQLLREAKNDSFVRRVYDDIRPIPEFFSAVMSAATTFNMNIANLPQTIQWFAERAELYTDKSAVVDTTMLSRRAPRTALTTLLEQNPWLLMLLVGSTLERVTIEVTLATGKGRKK